MWRADEKNAKRRRVAVTAEELSSYGGEISRQEAVAVTLETSGNDPRSDRLNALNLAWGGTLMTRLSLPSLRGAKATAWGAGIAAGEGILQCQNRPAVSHPLRY